MQQSAAAPHSTEDSHNRHQRPSHLHLLNPQVEHVVQEVEEEVEMVVLPALLSGAVQSVVFNPIDRALFLRVHFRRNFFDVQNWTTPFQGFGNAAMYRTLCAASYFLWQQEATRRIYADFPPEIIGHPLLVQFLVGTLAGGINGLLLNQLQNVKYQMWSTSSEGAHRGSSRSLRTRSYPSSSSRSSSSSKEHVASLHAPSLNPQAPCIKDLSGSCSSSSSSSTLSIPTRSPANPPPHHHHTHASPFHQQPQPWWKSLIFSAEAGGCSAGRTASSVGAGLMEGGLTERIARPETSHRLNTVHAPTVKRRENFFMVSKRMYTERGSVVIFFRGVGVSILRDAIFGIAYETLRYEGMNRKMKNSVVPSPLDGGKPVVTGTSPSEKPNNTSAAVHAPLGEGVSFLRCFLSNSFAALVASSVSAPLNYVRNIVYGSPSMSSALTTRQLLKFLVKECLMKRSTFRGRVSFINDRLNLGWGSVRVSFGMAVGQHLFSVFQVEMKKYF